MEQVDVHVSKGNPSVTTVEHAVAQDEKVEVVQSSDEDDVLVDRSELDGSEIVGSGGESVG